MSDNNIIESSTFTEIELSLIAVGLYLIISPIHGVSAITEPILKKLKIKTPIALLLFSGFLFGLIYYVLITIVLKPIYDRVKNVRVTGFKVGAQEFNPNPFGSNFQKPYLDENSAPTPPN